MATTHILQKMMYASYYSDAQQQQTQYPHLFQYHEHHPQQQQQSQQSQPVTQYHHAAAYQNVNAAPPPLSFRRILLTVIFTLIGIVLFVISIASPALYHSHVDSQSDNYADLGAFSMSAHITSPSLNNEIWTTSQIDNECNAQFNILGVELPKKQIVEKCSLWNAARGIMIGAIILGAIGLTIQFTSIRLVKLSILLRRLGSILPLLSSILGIICMSIYAHEKEHDSGIESDNHSTTTMGYGFYLLMIGCIFFLFAAATFGLPRKRNELEQSVYGEI